VETLRCPTCLSMSLVLQSGEQRCPMCHTRFGSPTRLVVHSENRANAAAHASARYATTRVEVDKPFARPPKPIIVDLPEEAIREVRTSVDAPSFPSTGVKPRPVPEPAVAPPPAPVRVPPPIARVVTPIARVVTPIARVVTPAAVTAPLKRAEPAPVESIHALPPEPVAARVRWWERVPLRWKIEFIERPEFGPPAPDPVRPPKPRAVEAPKAPAAPPARARVVPAPVPLRPAPRPREPNPMWRDRVFRGAPDDGQLAPVAWPRRSNA